jgi:predicted thioesterase
MISMVTTNHVVSTAAIARFAAAVGAADARIAPPTFPIVFLIGEQEKMLADPALAYDYSRVVHREQHFSHHRPIRPGDRLTVDIVLDTIELVRGNAVATFAIEISSHRGDTVCTGRASLVSRAPALAAVAA